MKTEKTGTILEDRFLWIDGDMTIDAKDVELFIEKGVPTSHLIVDELNIDIKNLNKSLIPSDKIRDKKELKNLDFSWVIPEEYKKLDVVNYVIDKLVIELDEQKFSETEASIREKRVSKELELFNSLEKIDVLRTIIYIINTFERNNVVWGVGRGSSTHSYVLYLLGAHDVDSVLFNLPIEDFLR